MVLNREVDLILSGLNCLYFFFFNFHISLLSALASYVVGESYGGEAMPLVPVFDTSPENITAIAGETISLPCAMEYKNEYKVNMDAN